MKFFTDEYFHIGRAHLGSGQACQDYALANKQKQNAWAIVSDGCSSGGKTDVGARLITLGTSQIIQKNIAKQNLKAKNIEIERQIILNNLQATLGLSAQDMLATCLYAIANKKQVMVNVCGDGVLALKYLNGDIIMHNFEWAKNMPYYPIYQNGLLEEFITAQGADLNAKCLKEEIWIMNAENEKFQCLGNEYALGKAIDGINLKLANGDLEELQFLALFSDGVTQIDGVEWQEAVKRLLSFKNTTGAFAKRRMIRFIKNTQKTGKGPIDDISFAIIGIQKE